MLTLDITSLPEGIHHLELSPSAGEVNLDPSTFHDIQVDAVLQHHRDRILVKLQAEATAELTCDRTLRPYEQAVDGNYNVLFGPPSMVGREGEEFDEVRPLDSSDREIDLTDIVRDTLLLAIPQRQVAPGAEDESIMQASGEPAEEDTDGSEVDPRWSELEKLKNED
jgi:uncharacterized protein